MIVQPTDTVTLIHGDCKDHLQAFDRDLTAIVADPPFGQNYRSSHHTAPRRQQYQRKEGPFAPIIGDDQPFDPSPLLPFRYVVLWGAQLYANRLPNCRQWLIWDKRAGKTPSDQSDCELAWTNQDKPTRIHTQLWRGIMRAGEENVTNGPKLGPAQKPVSLGLWTLEVMQIPKDVTILDPYMGTGSFAVAAIRAGYRYVGIEIDEGIFYTAADRITREFLQPTLMSLKA